MLKRLIMITSLMIVSTLSYGWAQNPLSISAVLGGGLLSPQSSSVNGNIFSAYDYPLSKTSFALNGKIRIAPSGLPFGIVGSVSYNSLFDSAILPVATSSGTVNEKFTYSLSILAIGVGVDYSFITTPVMIPYISIAGTLNLIDGNAKYENDVIPESGLNATSRIGLDLGIGTLIATPFLPLSMDIEAKYRFANLFGKQFDNSGPPLPGFGGLPQTPSYSLNDATNPNDGQDRTRSINYLTIVVGFSFTIL